jgi:hypothetical protein
MRTILCRAVSCSRKHVTLRLPASCEFRPEHPTNHSETVQVVSTATRCRVRFRSVLAALSGPTARDVANLHDFSTWLEPASSNPSQVFARHELSVRRFGMARRDPMIGTTDSLLTEQAHCESVRYGRLLPVCLFGTRADDCSQLAAPPDKSITHTSLLKSPSTRMI